VVVAGTAPRTTAPTSLAETIKAKANHKQSGTTTLLYF